jgi:dihydroflavonol-4-reductase
MRMMLTGATGLLGNNVARLAVRQGFDVVCPVRRLGDRSLADLPVRQCQVDFDQEPPAVVAGKDPGDVSPPVPSVWDSLVADCDVVVHSAAMIHIGWRQQAESRRVNVDLTERIAQAALRAGRRLVHISTVDTLAYSQAGEPVTETQRLPAKPGSAYVTSKTEAEARIQSLIPQGLDAVILHPGFMVGPWDWKPSSGKMIWAIAKRQIPLTPGGGCSAVDVRDVAQGILHAATRGTSGARYILAGHNLSYRDLFAEIAAVVGQRPPWGSLGRLMAMAAGAAGDAWTGVSGRETDLNSALIQMGQLRHYYSSEQAIQQLGYQLSPLRPALQDAWEFLRAHSN